MKINFLSLSLVFVLLACSNQRFILNKNYKVANKPSYSEQKIFQNWGNGDEQVLYNPQQYCPKNEILAKIEFKQRNYFYELVTFGYLQPRSIDVYCISSLYNQDNESKPGSIRESSLSKVEQKIYYTCKKEYEAIKKEVSSLGEEKFMQQCSIEKRKAFIDLGL